ncbi:MAG: acetoacetate decarboxylase family protein, partial [Promethearchaeota archaeon]
AGTFMESALLAQCIFDNQITKEEEVGVYFAHNYVDTDVAQAAGREIWGYPRKRAEIKLDMKKDTVQGTVVRDGNTLLKATCKLDEDGEWIDSGPNLNFKVIPSITGSGYDVAQLTAAYTTYDVKTGRSGDVAVEIRSGPRDDLSLIEIETPMIGLYFDVDITVPVGKVVGRIEL